MSGNKMRLQKFISEAGVASRRRAEAAIRDGLVKVNGSVARIGDRVDPDADDVLWRGKKVVADDALVYVLLNKPRGYVTTTDDELGRKCVLDLVEGVGKRVYPVGRLDRLSEGALLLTNDGKLAEAVTRPSAGVTKTYRVSVRPDITDERFERLASGVELEDGVAVPAGARVISRKEGGAVIELVLREGRNRQIRRMCAALGLETVRLKRTAVGPVGLGGLKVGSWRELDSSETDALFKAAGLKRRGNEKKR